MPYSVRENMFQKNRNSEFTPTLGWQILSFLTKYNTQHLTLARISQYFGVSAAAANRELRKISTYGFDELLSRARINGACAIMPMNGFSQQYLANYLGVSSEKAFYTAFYRWKQMTPMTYRKLFPTEVYGYSSNSIFDTPWSIVTYLCQNYLQPISVATAAKDLYINADQINPILLRYIWNISSSAPVRERCMSTMTPTQSNGVTAPSS